MYLFDVSLIWMESLRLEKTFKTKIQPSPITNPCLLVHTSLRYLQGWELHHFQHQHPPCCSISSGGCREQWGFPLASFFQLNNSSALSCYSYILFSGPFTTFVAHKQPSFLLAVSNPKLNTAFKLWSHQCRMQRFMYFLYLMCSISGAVKSVCHSLLVVVKWKLFPPTIFELSEGFKSLWLSLSQNWVLDQ